MTTNEQLKDEIRAGLQASLGNEALLEIIQRHKALGVDDRTAYDTLEELWRELGCHDPSTECEQTVSVADNLKQVMDIVWGDCSNGARIWDVPLGKDAV